MKRQPRWPWIAAPIALASWWIAVCAWRGADELAERAQSAGFVFLAIIMILSGCSIPVFVVSSVRWGIGNRRFLKKARRSALGLCVACSYSLHGNVSGVCPECGTEIDFTLANVPDIPTGLMAWDFIIATPIMVTIAIILVSFFLN